MHLRLFMALLYLVDISLILALQLNIAGDIC